MQIATGTALWYQSPTPVAIRWVLIRNPQGRYEPIAVLCTDQQTEAAQIVEWFVLRWAVEVTFHEVRAHMGVETQRQWSDLAGLFSSPESPTKGKKQSIPALLRKTKKKRELTDMNHTTHDDEKQTGQQQEEEESASIFAAFEKVKDGQKDRGKRYPLSLLLTLYTLGKLAGEQTVTGIVEWIKERELWRKKQLNWLK